MLMVAAGLIYALTLGTKPFVSTAAPHSMIQLRDALAKFGTVYLAGDGKGGSSREGRKQAIVERPLVCVLHGAI